MKKAKILKIISALVLIIVTGLIIGISFKKSNDRGKEIEKSNTVTPSNAKKVIDTSFISQKTDIKTIKRLTGESLTPLYIYVGKDSFVSTKPSKTIISKYNLEGYEKLQSKYAPIVENRFLNGTSYSFDKIDETTMVYYFKPWYYGAYSSDLQYLIQELIVETGEITKDDFMKATEKYTVYEYKARVKAMYILNDYLSTYDNKDEELKFTLILKDGKITKEDLYSIYMNFSGNRSVKVKGFFDGKATEERSESYYSKAIKDGIINTKDVLSINGLK